LQQNNYIPNHSTKKQGTKNLFALHNMRMKSFHIHQKKAWRIVVFGRTVFSIKITQTALWPRKPLTKEL